MTNLSVTSGDESFYLVPGFCHLLLVKHWTKDNYKFVMAQTVPLGRLNAGVLQVLKNTIVVIIASALAWLN